MPRDFAPMIHVPDVPAAVAWYESVGFVVNRTHEERGEVHWASLSFGDSELMLNAGGVASEADRREVDLYVRTEGVDTLYARLEDSVDVREPPHDSFYGMRELIVRDPNGFWVTFAEPARLWVLVRTDDNGNDFEVARFADREEAEEERRTYEAKGHKQLYAVRTAR